MPLGMLLYKLINLFELLLDYLVRFGVEWTKAADGQWELVHYHAEPTAKGTAILDAVVTIIHNGLDFVAQITTLLPALPDVRYENF